MWAIRQPPGSDTLPCSGARWPSKSWNRLDFPAPLAPTIATLWPGCTVRLTFSSNQTPPRCKLRSVIVNIDLLYPWNSAGTRPAMTACQPEPLNLPVTMEPDNPLWRYALACWRNPGLAQGCLELQKQGWSVTRILCAAWLGVNGRVFTGFEDAKVTEWRDRVTGSIRSARKSIPRHHEDCRQLREALASAELQAEQTELALAWQSIMTLNPETGTMQDTTAAILRNLDVAAPARTPEPDQMNQLHTLAAQLAGTARGDSQPCS